MNKELVPSELEDEKDLMVTELEPTDLMQFAHNMFRQIDNENTQEEALRFKKWAKNRAFYRGNQRGFWNNKSKKWESIDTDSLAPSDASLLVVNNQFRPQVKTLSKEFSRSLTRIRTNPLSDSQDATMASRFADALLKYHQPKALSESQRQLEAKYMLLCGNAFRYIYYSKKAPSTVVDVPIIGKKVLPMFEYSVCTDCGYESENKEEAQCKNCGGILEDITSPEKIVDAIIGYDKKNAGDVVIEVVDPVEIKMWAGASSMEESPYIRRKRIVKMNYIKNTYPFYSVDKSSRISEQGMNQWKFFDTSNAKDLTDDISSIVEYDQLWLEASCYADMTTEKSVNFKVFRNDKWEDVTIPENTPFKEVFPNGMYVCKVGNDILTFYDEPKNKCWVHIPFDISIDSVWADGLEDSVMNQQIINEYTSLSVENVLYNASPKLILNPSLINPVTLTGRPRDIVLMSDNARREPPRNAVHQLQGMNLTSEVQFGIEASKRDMREQTGALLAFNGQGDPNIQTATGMSIARDSALALIATPLAIRSEKDLITGKKILQLVKENWFDNKYRFLLGKYNESEANAFKRSILDETINLYIEPYSWMPQTNFERLENLGAYLTAFGLPLGFLNPNIPDSVREYAGQLYNIPFSFDELAPDRRIAQKRIDKAKEYVAKSLIAVQVEGTKLIQAGSPESATALFSFTAKTIADLMSIEEDIDNHPVFIDVYIKWLKTDEGQNAHPIFREAVKMVIADHRMFLQMQRGESAENEAIMNGGIPPQMNGMQGAWNAKTPADSPFASPRAGEVQDYSDNKDNKI